MVELTINVPEIKRFLNQIIAVPGKIFELLRVDMKESISRFLNQLMGAELTFFLGRGRYERLGSGIGSNHRNGSTARQFTIKGIGGGR